MKEIVNVNKNWGIGREGDLLVFLPEDMKFFRKTTAAKMLLMGRKTLESFPGKKPLKGRVNVVLTRDPSVIGTESIGACDAYYELSYANGVLSVERSVVFCEAEDDTVLAAEVAEAAETGETLEAEAARADICMTLKQNAEMKAAGAADKELRTLLIAVKSKEEALKLAALVDPDEVYVIGGAAVYELFLPEADTCIVTINDCAREADAYFPKLSELAEWTCTDAGEEQNSGDGDVTFRFTIWKRRA